MSKDYVVVTTITQFRHKYVMHKNDLQKLNPDMPVEPIEWACGIVLAEEAEEFSQNCLAETIIDTDTITEDEMLELFDEDNYHLRGWTQKYKIDWVRKRLNPAKL